MNILNHSWTAILLNCLLLRSRCLATN